MANCSSVERDIVSAVEDWVNPLLAQRVCRAVLERRSGRADKILMTGGRTTGHIAEAELMMLAAIAISLGNTTVVTEDGDLAAVPELMVENWLA